MATRRPDAHRAAASGAPDAAPADASAAAPADAPALGDVALRDFTGYAMKRAYMAIQTDFTETLAPLDLRVATFSALTLIVDRPDMTQSQLAAALSIERSGVVLIVDELEGRELITRNKVPTDRRTYALRATLAGRRLAERARAAAMAHEARMLGRLNPEERAQLHALLLRIETPAG